MICTENEDWIPSFIVRSAVVPLTCLSLKVTSSNKPYLSRNQLDEDSSFYNEN